MYGAECLHTLRTDVDALMLNSPCVHVPFLMSFPRHNGDATFYPKLRFVTETIGQHLLYLSEKFQRCSTMFRKKLG